MQVTRITSYKQLCQLREQWNCLARGVPFRSWQWLLPWWSNYGDIRELYVLCIRNDQGLIVGIAPWYLEYIPTRGRTLRMLGSGEVHSEYLSLLTTPEYESSVSDVVADWLCLMSSHGDDGWDILHLENVEREDTAVLKLIDGLRRRGCKLNRRSASDCWRLALPSDWTEYLASLSDLHRKQVAYIERQLLDTDRVRLRCVQGDSEVSEHIEVLREIDARRQASQGLPKSARNKRFGAFLRQSAEAFSKTNRMQLLWIEMDGRPAAAEIHLLGERVKYVYFAAVDPQLADENPRRVMHTAMLRAAIEEGWQAIDFLRGGDAYGMHWRASPVPAVDIRVSANRAISHLRGNIWMAEEAVAEWVKGGLGLPGLW